MQNISYRVPGTHLHWTVSPSGVITRMDEPASSYVVLLTQTSSSGRRPKQKPMPVNPYGLNLQRIAAMQIQGDYFYSSGAKEFANGPILNTVPRGATYPPFDSTNLYNEAVSKLNDKSRGDLDISVDLAEAHKTGKMFNATKNAVDYWNQFWKRSGPKWVRALAGGSKVAANAWLEFTYGWKPLASTLYGAADESLRLVVNKIEHHRGRASQLVVPAYVTLETIWGPVNFPVVGGGIKYSITLGVALTTDQHDPARWSSLNPVSIAWELMPYSFVVDWFYDVGGYLRNVETSLLYMNRFRTGYRTDLSVSKVTCQITDKLVSAGETHSSIHRGTVEHVDINRKVLTSYPAPYLPSFEAKLGSSRLLSAASLLRQRMK